jgi:hypothetical protein
MKAYICSWPVVELLTVNVLYGLLHGASALVKRLSGFNSRRLDCVRISWLLKCDTVIILMTGKELFSSRYSCDYASTFGKTTLSVHMVFVVTSRLIAVLVLACCAAH